MQAPSQHSLISVLRMLFFAMLFGQISFGAIIAFVMGKTTAVQLPIDSKIAMAIVVLFSAVAILVAYKVYAAKLLKARACSDTKQKLEGYKTASIVRWAIMEGVCLLNVILFFVLGDFNFLFCALAVLALFLTTMPTSSKLINELGIDMQDLDAA